MSAEPVATFELWGITWDVIDIQPPFVNERSGLFNIHLLRPHDWESNRTVTIRGHERDVAAGVYVKGWPTSLPGPMRRYVEATLSSLTDSNLKDLYAAYVKAVPDGRLLTHEESMAKVLVTAELVGSNAAADAWRRLIPWTDYCYGMLTPDDIAAVTEAAAVAFRERMLRGH